MNFKVGDPVVNRTSREKGTITEVSDFWGWYVVTYESGYERRYDNLMKDNETTVTIDTERVDHGIRP